MSNIKHPMCKIRNLASEAKMRLQENNYHNMHTVSDMQKLTPMELTVLSKMREILNQGQEIKNPISQLCDRRLLNSLESSDRQRYVLEISNAYLNLKQKMMDKLQTKQEA